ncbi:DUF551 domain-containing protein [Bacteroides fragilis]
MKQTVEEAEKEYYEKNYPGVDMNRIMVENAFEAGADWQAEQSPWISVKERLPESNITVLTKGAYGYLICFLSNLGEWETGANINEERLGITHWMPIPSFDEILEANRDVLERIKEKGD